MNPFRGVIVASVTPFRTVDGAPPLIHSLGYQWRDRTRYLPELDEGRIEFLVERAVAAGVHGFLVCGSTGELTSLLRPIVRVPDTIPADRLLTFLRERRSHQALVLDAAGRVAGLITLEDVLGELLGGVADEFKSVRVRSLRPREEDAP